MKYNILTSILIALSMCCEADCFAQGKVSRPTQQQSQTSKPKKSTPKVTVSEPDGYINGHGYVDLGLPSGTKWATCNIGANSPEKFGDYYAWGELETKDCYIVENYWLPWRTERSELKLKGIVDDKFNLLTQYDAACRMWGKEWIIPKYKHIKELIDKCIWEVGLYKNILGYKITGVNKKSIFLPAAGIFGENINLDKSGQYLISTLPDSNQCVSCLLFVRGYKSDNYFYETACMSRQLGYSIRAVLTE